MKGAAMNPVKSAAAVVVALAIAAVATAASAQADPPTEPLQPVAWRSVTGSGQLRSEARAVTGFQAISVRGSITLVLRQGAREGVELRADDNLLPLLEARVVDHGGVPTLEIGAKDDTEFSSRHPIVATVDLVTLRALNVAGSCDVTSESLKVPGLRVAMAGSGQMRLRQLAVDELSVKVSGSGEIELAGRAATLALAVAGSGNANARGLEADDASVNVAGSGDATVNARKTLNVSIAGSGRVAYTGSAAVKTAIAGSGSVKRL
jgi:hypothetical protein